MLPEVTALHHVGRTSVQDRDDAPLSGSLVRIPPQEDVPISDRVRRILDTAPMRRLASISQLGMVSLVYPGATHSRLEHSLGVYHNALRLLARFSSDQAFSSTVDHRAAEAFVVAALLHDVGHWPFCHPIEDMQLADLGEHESRIGEWISNTELAECIGEDWGCEVSDVLSLLDPRESPSQASDSSTSKPDLASPSPGSSPEPSPERSPESSPAAPQSPLAQRFFTSCLSGPIDIDKLDYLQRDSLHAGVPYGRNFDAGRLINSLALNPNTSRLAIGGKGRTAAEMMVFARYVMFSEVYWHHAVRSATAMLQRCVFLMLNRMDLESTLRMVDSEWIAMLRRAAEGSVAEPLAEGLFGSRRRLYKRAAEFNVIDGNEVHQRLARKPYWWQVACSERIASALSMRTGVAVQPVDVLIDAPPAKLEVDINMDVVARDGTIRTLGEVSPVASALAQQQFDSQVKRVRVFVRDDLRAALADRMSAGDWADELLRASQSLEQELV